MQADTHVWKSRGQDRAAAASKHQPEGAKEFRAVSFHIECLRLGVSTFKTSKNN
jgi:hypothetical protein